MKLVVLGHPIAHSLSPAMFAAAFRASGIDGTYDARDLAPPLEQGALDALGAEGVHGASVTVPHKEAALALCAERASATARAIGAANVLTRIEREWSADNTDGPGFVAWVRGIDGARARVRRAVVLGAGGSARAIVWALLECGADRVLVVNRTRARAAALAGDFAGRAHAGGPEEIPDDALVVHCTPAGLRPGDPLPLDEASLGRIGCLLDLVYPDTEFVRAMRARSVPAEDGLGLLVRQGTAAFRLWTGRDVEPAVMLAGARAELERRAGLPRS